MKKKTLRRDLKLLTRRTGIHYSGIVGIEFSKVIE